MKQAVVLIAVTCIVTIILAQPDDDFDVKGGNVNGCNNDKGPVGPINVNDPIKGKGTGCGKLVQPSNGHMDLEVGLETDMEKASFSCDPGYELVGPRSLTCKKSNWEGKEPTCKPVDCGRPKAPENGRVEYLQTTFQAKAHYFCEPCATLIGTKRITCKKSGVWSRTVPVCVLNKECPPLKLPDSALVSRRNLADTSPRTAKCGEQVKIRCLFGYKLIGTGNAVCQPDGSYKWEGQQKSYCYDLKWT